MTLFFFYVSINIIHARLGGIVLSPLTFCSLGAKSPSPVLALATSSLGFGLLHTAAGFVGIPASEELLPGTCWHTDSGHSSAFWNFQHMGSGVVGSAASSTDLRLRILMATAAD